jgi:hypothetical protein
MKIAALKDKIKIFYKTHKTLSSIITIILAVLLANSAYIFLTNPDPLISRSLLPIESLGIGNTGGTYLKSQLFGGGNSIEPNDGFTKQALGVQANNQILSGQIPLWNHYEAIGAPLLGETQSAATFPFTLLLSLPYGFLIYHILLEIIAGIGMYLLLCRFHNKKRQPINNSVAITGGILFATLGPDMM